MEVIEALLQPSGSFLELLPRSSKKVPEDSRRLQKRSRRAPEASRRFWNVQKRLQKFPEGIWKVPEPSGMFQKVRRRSRMLFEALGTGYFFKLDLSCQLFFSRILTSWYQEYQHEVGLCRGWSSYLPAKMTSPLIGITFYQRSKG